MKITTSMGHRTNNSLCVCFMILCPSHGPAPPRRWACTQERNARVGGPASEHAVYSVVRPSIPPGAGSLLPLGSSVWNRARERRGNRGESNPWRELARLVSELSQKFIAARVFARDSPCLVMLPGTFTSGCNRQGWNDTLTDDENKQTRRVG